MDKGTYNKSIYGGCTLPQELVLHSTAAGHKECEGFCFIRLFKLNYEIKLLNNLIICFFFCSQNFYFNKSRNVLLKVN